jgi:hypothetical protein
MEPVTPPSSGISRTSVYTAAGRAVGAREPDHAARNPDDLAEKLLGDPSKLALDHPAVHALSLGYDEAMKVCADRLSARESARRIETARARSDAADVLHHGRRDDVRPPQMPSERTRVQQRLAAYQLAEAVVR